jgi:transcriptional regulator with XRE-family HTH domain
MGNAAGSGTVQHVSDRFALVVARAVRAERARAGLSQTELGERIGTSRAWIAAVEAGTRTLPVAVLPELCRELGVPLRLLFDRADAEDLDWLGLR